MWDDFGQAALAAVAALLVLRFQGWTGRRRMRQEISEELELVHQLVSDHHRAVRDRLEARVTLLLAAYEPAPGDERTARKRANKVSLIVQVVITAGVALGAVSTFGDLPFWGLMAAGGISGLAGSWVAERWVRRRLLTAD